MPSVQDYDPSEEEDVQAGGGGLAPSGGGATQAADKPSKQQESSFTPWSRFVSANADVSQREAGKLAAGVRAQGEAAEKGREAAQGAQETAIASNYKPAPPKPAFGSISGFGGGHASFADPQPTNAMTQQMAARAPPPSSALNLRSNAVAGAPQTGPMTVIEAPERVIDPDKLKTDISGGAWKTGAGDLAGGKDLESQVGKDAWGRLLGDTMKAGASADALKSESGVQALLGPQATAFDAALIGGAGNKQFQDIAKQYGGGTLMKGLSNANMGAQDAWHRLMGDVDEAARGRDSQIAAANQHQDIGAPGASTPGAPAAPTGYGYQPGGFGSYKDFKEKLAVGGGIHDLGEDISPADAALRELGKHGLYSGQTVAGTFRQNTLGGMANGVAGSLDDQNRFDAFNDIEAKYGAQAAGWLWDWMTEGIWNGMAGQNSGAMYKTLSDIIEQGIADGTLIKDKNGNVYPKGTPQQQAANDAKQKEITRQQDFASQRTSGQSVTGKDGTSREMTPEQYYYRAQAEKDGWLDEWERQFLSGVDSPTNPNQQPTGQTI